MSDRTWPSSAPGAMLIAAMPMLVPIRRIQADLGELTEHDQALIHDAVTVIRKTRQLVNLGMPGARPAASTR